VSDFQQGEEFPCFYTFKVFGRRSDTFADTVRRIVGVTLGQIGFDSMKVRESAGGRYLAVSIVTRVDSRAQLEQVYADLHAEQEVLFCI
jgi:putative lipoic acid-binding regulatory protein